MACEFAVAMWQSFCKLLYAYFTLLFTYVSKFCLDKWQDVWDNKLRHVYPTLGIVTHNKNVFHHDCVILCKL